MWVFARHTDEALAGLVTKLDHLVAISSLKQAAALTAIVGDDPDAIRAGVRQFADDYRIEHVILTMPKRHDIGDRQLRLADEAEVTVMIAKDRKIVANHAFAAGQLDVAAIEKILADFKSLLEN